jgi:hypothetical protein
MSAGRSNPGHWKPLGYVQIPNASLSSAVGLTGVPSNADMALFHVDGGSGVTVRWRDDGTDPASSVGMEIAGGDPFYFQYHGDLTAIKFIAGAGTPVLDIAYYKYD